MNRMKKLSETISTLLEEEFSGYIKINFSQGNLGRIEKSEEFEDAEIMLVERNNGKKRSVGEAIGHATIKTVPVMLLLSAALAGCVSAGMVKPAQPGSAGNPGKGRIVQSGDVAEVSYICSLKSGEVVAATGPVAGNRPKSNLYVPREGAGPLPLTATKTDGEQAQGAPYKQLSLEEEISHQLAGIIVGMKEGTTGTAELKAKDAPAPVAAKYMARLSRVRTRPKEMKMPKGDYEYRTGKSPEVGQAYSYDPDFPGTVVSVSDKEVTIRFTATPGAVLSTPFGPGRIREEGGDYKVDIEARKGALVRAADMVGRISDVDDKVIIVDFGNPFGGETLFCDVTVEKITNEKLVKNESGGR